MPSNNTLKLIQLAAGLSTTAAGLIGAVVNLIKALNAPNSGTDPSLGLGSTLHWAWWSLFAALLLFGVWLLIKWRTRYSRILKPEALRLDRDNPEHLVGRADDIEILFQRCHAKQITFLEGESGSGKSALVRAGLLPRLEDDKSILPLMLGDLWVDEWERGPFQALKFAMVNSGAFAPARLDRDEANQAAPVRPLSTLAELEQALTELSDRAPHVPLIVFDQFDDYQTRNQGRFLIRKTWIDPDTLRRDNPFWDMIARLLAQDRLHCLFVTRKDSAGGLTSVQFIEPVVMRIDSVASTDISELLTRLTTGTPEAPVIADPKAGWTRLRERIVHDLTHQGVVLPQQLKIILAGIQGLRPLNVAEYERAGGAAGIEALYVERQINAAARKTGLETRQIRAMLVELIEPADPSRTRACSEQALAVAAEREGGSIAPEKLNRALEELEGGEIVRIAGDQDTGSAAYRLDHDNLTRGVRFADRNANRSHYLLVEGAEAWRNAGSGVNKWKAYLPIGSQCRLAWERLRGSFRYGQQRRYAIESLLRFVPLVLILALSGFGYWQYETWRAQSDAQDVWDKFVLQSDLVDLDVNAAWHLTGTTKLGVRSKFLDLTLRKPEFAERFLRHPAFVVQALAGLDPNVRAKLAQSLEANLSKNRYGVTEVAAIAVATYIGRTESINLPAIVKAVKSNRDVNRARVLARALVDVAPRFAVNDTYGAAAEIVAASSNSLDPKQLDNLRKALAIIAPNLYPGGAVRLANMIVAALFGEHPNAGSDPTDRVMIQSSLLAKELKALAPYLDSKGALEVASKIVRKLQRGYHRARDHRLYRTLRILEQYKKVWLVDAPEQYWLQNIGAWRLSIGRALAALTRQLTQGDARAFANEIVAATKDNRDADALHILAQAWSAIAQHGGTGDTTALADRIVTASKGQRSASRLHALAQALATIAPHQKLNKTAVVLAGEIAKASNSNASRLHILAQALMILAPLTEPQGHGAEALASKAIATLQSGVSRHTRPKLVRVLIILAPYLRPDHATVLASKIVARSKGRRGADELRALAEALAALWSYTRPAEIAAVAGEIITARKDEAKVDHRRALAQALAALAPHVKWGDAEDLANEIVAEINRSRDVWELQSLAHALAALKPRVSPDDMSTLRNKIVEEMRITVEADSTPHLSSALVALTEQLPWPERLRTLVSALKFPGVFGKSREILIKAIKEHPNAGKIKPPGDIWAVIAWLQEHHPEIDLASPPRPPKSWSW